MISDKKVMLVPERVARYLRALADQIELGAYVDGHMQDEFVTVREYLPDGSVHHHRTGERVIMLRLFEARYFVPQPPIHKDSQKNKEVQNGSLDSGRVASHRTG